MKKLFFFICLVFYSVSIGQTSNLTVAKTSPNAHYQTNSTLTFVITITNNGPTTTIFVNDNPPMGTTNMVWNRTDAPATTPNQYGSGAIHETVPIANGQTITYQVEVFVPTNYNVNSVVSNQVLVISNLEPTVPYSAYCNINPAPKHVSVDTNSHTTEQLVRNVLLKDICPGLVSNINASSCDPTNGTIGIGYFNSNNSSFSLKEGIIIRNGNANFCQGPFTDEDLSSSCTGSGTTDAFLQNLATQAGAPGNVQDVTFLEFDFIPMRDSISFNFLFSSNEYGPFQCTYGDVFGFQLTDLTTNLSENLAVIPNTNIPVSVVTIRDNQYNSMCPSENVTYFDSFNITPNLNTPINMRGYTIPMRAAAQVVPCRPYRIRFAVGDMQDSQYDTAVFLEAGSFDIGNLDLGDPHLISNGQPLCPDSNITLDTGFSNSGCITFQHQWYKNGTAIPGATASTYVVQYPDSGDFKVEINATVNSTGGSIGCSIENSIFIESQTINTTQPVDKVHCSGNDIFDLTDQEAIIMATVSNPTDYDISYYNTTLQDAQNGANPINVQPTNNNIQAYQGTNGQVIYIRIEHISTGCAKIEQFTLTIRDCQITTPDDVVVCDDNQDGNEIFNLSNFDTGILSGLTGFDITYHTSQNDAQSGINPITNTPAPNGPTVTVNTNSTEQIWIRVVDAANPSVVVVDSFNITVHPVPVLIPNINYELCDQNGDGQEIFDLTSIEGQLTTDTGIAFSYFESQTDAQNNANNITTPTAYASSGATIWVRAVNTNNCQSIISFNLVVKPLDIKPDLPKLESCKNNGAATATFDLSTAVFSPALNTGDVPSYYTSLADAQQETNAIANPTAYSIGADQTVFIRVQAASPNCPYIVKIDLDVLDAPVVSSNITPYELCEPTIGVATATFDLTTKLAEITTATGVTTTYHTNMADAVSGTNPIANTTSYTAGSQTIWVRVQDNNTGCFNTTSFAIVVNNIPQATAPNPMQECNDGTGAAAFNLVTNDAQITGGVAGVSVSYHITLADAQNGTNALTSPYTLSGTTNATLYIRVYNTHGCVNTSQTIDLQILDSTINPTLADLTYCDPNSDGFGQFDLTQVAATITAANPTAVNISYHLTPADAEFGANPIQNPTAYANNNPYTQTIYVRVEHTHTTHCATYSPLTLIVHNLPQILTPAPFGVCDDNTDGFALFNLYDAVPSVIGTLNPATNVASFYTSLADAQAGTNPIGNPASYTNTTVNQDTVWVRIDDTNTGCFDVRELTIVVHPLPGITTPSLPPYHLCDTGANGTEVFDLDAYKATILGTLTGIDITYYATHQDAVDAQNALPLQYTATATTQTVFVRAQTTHGCYVISLLDLVLEPLPVFNFPASVVACDDNNDGFGLVNLDDVYTQILGTVSPTLFTITFHETLTDAQLNQNQITNTAAYPTNQVNTQTIYVRAENIATGCYVAEPIVINITDAPIIPLTPNGEYTPLAVCDTDNDGIAPVNFTATTQTLLSYQVGAATNYTVTYHTSQADAQAGTNAIMNTTSYQNISSPQLLWIRMTINNSGCFTVAPMTLTVYAPLTLPTLTSFTACDDNMDGVVTFNLNELVDDILVNATNQSNYTVTFYPSLVDAQAGTNPIANPEAYVSTTNTTSLGISVTHNASGCQSFMTIDLRQSPMPTVPSAVAPIEICQDQNATTLEGTFDITIRDNFIRQGDPSLIITHHLTEYEAQEGINPIANPNSFLSLPRTIYIRVAYPAQSGTVCFVTVPVELIVNPLPQVIDSTFEVCDDNNDGIASFVFSNFASQLLGPTQNPSDFLISYHNTLNDANNNVSPLPSVFTNTAAGTQIIAVRIVNATTGCVTTSAINLVVEDSAVVNQASTLFLCDNVGLNDGFVTGIDLTSTAAEILGTQNPSTFVVSYYLTAADAAAGTNPIDNPTNFTNTVAYGQIIFVRVVSANSTIPCFATGSFLLQIEKLAEPVITSPNYVLCVDYGNTVANNTVVLNSNVTTPGYTYQWYLEGNPIAGATQSTLSVNNASDAGYYTVIVTSPNGCASVESDEFQVILSGAPEFVEYTLSEPFETSQNITVTVQGNGEYVYQLGNGPIQESNVFVNVPSGVHTITVYTVINNDINHPYSCGNLVIEDILLVTYPRFFTPNGDGYNDTWNISGLTDKHRAEIFIFDRYGKLLKQLNPLGNGWDGTYHGLPMPSTDYWFKVNFNVEVTDQQGQTTTQRKEFKSHFSLKR